MEFENNTLLTDLYQITMNASYFDNNKDDIATFELFIRNLPKDWGFFIANGIEDAADYATEIKFSENDISYLREQGIFQEKYLNFLQNFKFNGRIRAVADGTPVFPNMPIMSITGKRTEVQFLETLLLNTVNFQTLIASKARRIVVAAGSSGIVDFGLRRAQGKDAAIKGARAAYIVGAKATSNVMAGKKYGIPISGTHAHSFVMSFDSEIEAFRAYAKTFPNNATLLIDTYNTIKGAENAVIVAKELEQKGFKLGAVRLDSGNLCELSKQVRRILDNNELNYVKILASNDLNEYKLSELTLNNAKIDGYGVGTEMITAKPVSAISGVYKLVQDSSGGKMKMSKGKSSYPGEKQVYRILNDNKMYIKDILALNTENILDGIPLLETIIENGKRVFQRKSLEETKNYCLNEISKFPPYVVGRVDINENLFYMEKSPGLKKLIEETRKKFGENE